jgi:transcriptional regulator with XRE-family HTH domain|tara:strand:+ start:1285 stop:1560 length:276 start_codon:yes stop_codon:yes gene_type:complete
MKNQWGKIVREIRREKDISIKQLGRLSDVGENTVGNIERRSQNCSVQILEKILSPLGYELEAMAIDPKPIRFISAKVLYEGKIGGMNDELI